MQHWNPLKASPCGSDSVPQPIVDPGLIKGENALATPEVEPELEEPADHSKKQVVRGGRSRKTSCPQEETVRGNDFGAEVQGVGVADYPERRFDMSSIKIFGSLSSGKNVETWGSKLKIFLVPKKNFVYKADKTNNLTVW